MTEVRIRSATADDAPRLALVGAATFLETFAGVIDGDAIVAHCAGQHSAELYASWLADNGVALWIAEASGGGAPVGYLALTKPDLPLSDIGEADAEVKRIYLLSRFRGTGTGRALMDLAVEAARLRGKRRLLLGCYRHNAQAIGFYRALGFETVGERRFQVGAKLYDDVVMARAL